MLKTGSISFRLALAILCMAVGVFSAIPAAARNVPGSASVAVGEVSEASTASIMGGIHNGLLRARGDDRRTDVTRAPGSPVFSFANIDMALTNANAGFIGPNGLGAAINLGYRKIDNADLDVGVMTGSALLLYRTSYDLLLFGGVVGESAEGDTFYNSGTVESRGVGLAAGLDYRAKNGLNITATLAYLDLDYDITRSGGAITGAFGAKRVMADALGNYRILRTDTTTDLNFGVRYIRQTDDAYTEIGGAPVGSASHTRFSLLGGGRVQFERSGVNPFLEGEVRYDLVNESSLSPGVTNPNDRRLHTRLGVGLIHAGGNTSFEAGLGVHATEYGYDGYDGFLRVLIRF